MPRILTNAIVQIRDICISMTYSRQPESRGWMLFYVDLANNERDARQQEPFVFLTHEVFHTHHRAIERAIEIAEDRGWRFFAVEEKRLADLFD